MARGAGLAAEAPLLRDRRLFAHLRRHMRLEGRRHHTASATLLAAAERVTSFYIPGVFTPHGERQNDQFDSHVKGIDEFTIVIYNRWGTKVYESEMVDDTWDGGDEPDGTYYYIVRGKEQTLEAEPVEYRGDLTLIRN